MNENIFGSLILRFQIDFGDFSTRDRFKRIFIIVDIKVFVKTEVGTNKWIFDTFVIIG